MTLSPLVKKTLIGSIAITVALIGIIGFAHTKSGRFLLPYIPGMGDSCPVGGALPLDKLDQARDLSLKKILDGHPKTNQLNFLSFDLQKTSKDQVLLWIKEQKLKHELNEKQNQITVSDVKISAIGSENTLLTNEINEISLMFSSQQSLISIVIRKTFSQAEEISTYFQARKEQLLKQYGQPSQQKGEGTVNSFSVPLFQQVVEYLFANARINITASQFKAGQYNLVEYIQRPTQLD